MVTIPSNAKLVNKLEKDGDSFEQNLFQEGIIPCVARGYCVGSINTSSRFAPQSAARWIFMLRERY